ncbi:MarR family winged helix-turn-helix transcriptional regulator [Nocardia xishanensis]|uniref:MarR family winged helix-turn-helix transcriptional regulator n=1 Tax=Nocardia xishanensis TaxID=238964 RepID=A0ABW7XBN8_9NOCA
MKNVKAVELPETLAFRLGLLGAFLTDRFSTDVSSLGLKPKHAGLLNALAANGPTSQMEMAQMLRVAPSLVVALADHLGSLGAIERLRDPEDRRRQNLNLTSHGRALLRKCLDAAQAIDAETTADLTAAERTDLHRILGTLADRLGLPS